MPYPIHPAIVSMGEQGKVTRKVLVELTIQGIVLLSIKNKGSEVK